MSYNTYPANALLQLLMGSGAFDPKTGAVTPATGNNRPGMTPPIAPTQGQGGQAPMPPSPPIIDPSLQIQGAPGPMGAGGQIGPVIDTRLSGGAPNRDDYFSGIGKYQDLPTYQAPTRDLQGEAKQNLLGVGLAGLGSLLFGGGKYLPQTLQGYMGGATSAQDQAFQNKEQQAQGQYNAQAGAINSANQNVARQTADAQRAYDDAQQDYGRQQTAQEKADALAEKTKQGKLTAFERDYMKRLGNIAQQPLAVQKQMIAALNDEAKANGSDRYIPAPGTFLGMGKDANGNPVKQFMPGLTPQAIDQYRLQAAGLAAGRTQLLPREIAVKESNAASMATNAGTNIFRAKDTAGYHAGMLAQGQERIGQAAYRLAQGDRNYGLAVNRLGLAQQQFDALQQNRNANDLRTFGGTVRSIYQDLNGPNGYSTRLAKVSGQLGHVTAMIQGKKDQNGNDLTPQALDQLGVTQQQLQQQAADLAAMRDETKARLGTYSGYLKSVQQGRLPNGQAPAQAPPMADYGTPGISKGAPPVPRVTVMGGNGGPKPKVTLPPVTHNGKSLKQMTNDELMALAMKGQGK